MHHQPIPGFESGDSAEALAQAILGLLIDDHQGLWSLSELDRSLTSSGRIAAGAEPPRHVTEDAVEALYAAGLLHRVGQFVFASRAAHAAQRLAG
jgi:HD-like signal output (HDOD) protein